MNKHLLTFINIEKENLDNFEKYWIEQNKNDSVNFPLSILEGDWLEQFEFFKAINKR
jgi:hypothetical protein